MFLCYAVQTQPVIIEPPVDYREIETKESLHNLLAILRLVWNYRCVLWS